MTQCSKLSLHRNKNLRIYISSFVSSFSQLSSYFWEENLLMQRKIPVQL